MNGTVSSLIDSKAGSNVHMNCHHPPPTNGHSPKRAASHSHLTRKSSQKVVDTTEMFIASADELLDHSKDALPRSTRKLSMRVPLPRAAPPQMLDLTSDGGRLMRSGNSMDTNMRSLKKELGLIKTELRDASSELKESQQSLRAKDGEIVLLKAALAGRDINLRNSKAQLNSAQVSLKEKDAELQEAYEQLMSNARERGHVRNQLLSTQAELAAANKELTHWAQHASETDSPAAENRTYSRLLPPGAESQSGDIGEGSEQHIAEGRNEWSVSSNMDRRNHSTEVAQMMNNLSELSGQMATDAVANEAAFQEKPAHGHYNPSN